MHSKEEIFTKMVEILSQEFEIEQSDISADSQLFQDLDLDSIDAIDLIVHLQKFIAKKISPEEFKQVRTIADVVDVIYAAQ